MNPPKKLKMNKNSPACQRGRFYIFTLGCQMNISDSQRIATKFNKKGYKSASEKEADLIIVNACSVRQKAVDRVWGKINQWQKLNKKIILTGCVLPSDKKKFQSRGVEFKNFAKDNFFDIIPQSASEISYIPIMTGCDNYCSYCAVPYTRGREKSRSIQDVIHDAKLSIKNGSKEILLLGQNVNSYSVNNKCSSVYNLLVDNKGFIKLLNKIDNLSGDFEFNFISSNPHDFSDELIETFAKLKKWPRELHLPLQSGDDEILKAMNRKYSSSQYLKLIKNLKLKIENLTLTTDIIVGFPGETKEQFNHTVAICKKIKFTKAYIAQYSPRTGTAAAKLNDNISPTERKRRWLILEELIN